MQVLLIVARALLRPRLRGGDHGACVGQPPGIAAPVFLRVAGAAVASRGWVSVNQPLAVVPGAFWAAFCLGKRLALGRGHLERTWAAKARAGNDGLGDREDATRRILPM